MNGFSMDKDLCEIIGALDDTCLFIPDTPFLKYSIF